MAAAVTLKSKDGIRFQSGNLFLVKLGTGAWEGLGHCLGGKLEIKADKNSAVLSDGETVSKRGKREGTFAVTLAQTNKAVLDRILALSGDSVAAYYNNGKEGGKMQEIYIPALEIIEDLSLDMKGQQHQSVVISGTMDPADNGLAVCTPDTDLPEEASATGTTPQNSSNPYCVILETTITP
jgi:hypothetical protein